MGVGHICTDFRLEECCHWEFRREVYILKHAVYGGCQVCRIRSCIFMWK